MVIARREPSSIETSLIRTSLTFTCRVTPVSSAQVVLPIITYSWMKTILARTRCSSFRLHYAMCMRGQRGQCLSLRLCTVSVSFLIHVKCTTSRMMLLDADIVCARARNHFDPMGSIEVGTGDSPTARAAPTIAAYKSAFKPAKAPLANNMVCRVFCPWRHFC